MGLARATSSETVGRFRLIRALGGRAGTFAARENDAELVVVHRVPTGGRGAAILGDARKALDIEHPCVVRVRAVEAAGADVLVSTDYADGEIYDELGEAARLRNEPIPLGVTLRILGDVLSALSAMHDTAGPGGRRVHLVHGRLAPFDVLVGVDGTARLVLGARWTRGDDAKLIGYLAPEVVLGGDADADERTDVYAVGVMLWEALAGRRLYDVRTSEALLAQQLKGRVEPPPTPKTALWAAPLAPVAARALAADPKDRYVSTAAMHEALLEVAGRRIATVNDVANTVEALVGPFIRARRREVAQLAASDVNIRATAPDGDERTLAVEGEGEEPKTEVDIDLGAVKASMRRVATASDDRAPITDHPLDGEPEEPRTQVDMPFSPPALDEDRTVHPADHERATRQASVAIPPQARPSFESISGFTPPTLRKPKPPADAGSMVPTPARAPEPPPRGGPPPGALGDETPILQHPRAHPSPADAEEIPTRILAQQTNLHDIYTSDVATVMRAGPDAGAREAPASNDGRTLGGFAGNPYEDLASTSDPYEELSSTSRRAVPRLYDPEPDIEQGYAETATFAKGKVPLGPPMATDETLQMPHPRAPSAPRPAAGSAPPELAPMRTAPIVLARGAPPAPSPPVDARAPARDHAPAKPFDIDNTERMYPRALIDAARAALARPALSSRSMRAAQIVANGQPPPAAPAAPGAVAPTSPPPAPASAGAATMSTRASTPPPRRSWMLGVITFLLVVASVILLAWFTFPWWRHFAKL